MALLNINLAKDIPPSTNTQSSSSSPLHFDKSEFILFASNLITILMAVIQKWNLTEVMWVYWLQSVIIGLFYFKKILDIRNFTTIGFKTNNIFLGSTVNTKNFIALFFLVHYNIFHFGYLVFLLIRGIPTNIFTLILLGISFFINHLFSYLENKEADSKKVYNIGTVMFLPYQRIIPMHLIIILGGLFVSSNLSYLVLFMALKAIADIKMHQLEHQNYQIKEELNDSKQ